jgi:hypothetical protein
MMRYEMNKLKTPKEGAGKRLRELYYEIRNQPFSKELIDALRKKPEASKVPDKKSAKGDREADV